MRSHLCPMRVLPAFSPKSFLSLLALTLFGAADGIAATPDMADGQASRLGQAEAKADGSAKASTWFPEAGFGLFIHWGLASVQAKGDLSWCMMANKSWHDGTVKPVDYYAAAKVWKPDRMDFDAMLRAAKAAGFQYAVFVTKHHDGFTLWPSAYGDIGTKGAFGGRDFVREYVDACRRNGLRVGLYYSPPDWWYDREYMNWSFGGGRTLGMDHRPVKLPPKPASHRQGRIDLVRGQVEELLTRYGKIDLLWFDGGAGEMPNTRVRELQPGIVINARNGPGGDYGASEGHTPRTRFKGDFESCIPNWPVRMWTWREPAEYGSHTPAETLTQLVVLRAWGGNLLANLGPKGDGSVDPGVLADWQGLSAWMRHSGESVFRVTGGPWPERVNQPVTVGDGVAYIHFIPTFPEKLGRVPPEENKFTRLRDVIPTLPSRVASAVWRDAPRPARVTLLRTGESVPFTHEGGTLTVSPPESSRTGEVDVVKVEWAKP